MSKNENKVSIKVIAVLAILIAMEIVLSRFLSIKTHNMKIGLAFIPIVFAGHQYGKTAGLIVGGLSDFLGAILFPIGPYFPGFTVTAALIGFYFGWLLYKNVSIKNIVIAVLVTQIFGSLLLNTLWLSILFKSPYLQHMLTRIIQFLIMSIIQIVTLPFILKNFDKHLKQRFFYYSDK